LLSTPSAQANTIRERNANACADFRRRDQRISCSRSSPVRTNSALGRPVLATPQFYHLSSGLEAQDTSKAGVIGLTKALAREVSARGVHVNAIAPGPILTDMMAEETEEWAAKKLAELPMGRFGQPEEVAPTAVFLASDDSSYFVGQTLCPNGGDVML